MAALVQLHRMPECPQLARLLNRNVSYVTTLVRGSTRLRIIVYTICNGLGVLCNIMCSEMVADT